MLLYVPGVSPQCLLVHELQLYSGNRWTLSSPAVGHGMQSNVPDSGHQVTLLVSPDLHNALLQGEHTLLVVLVQATDSYLDPSTQSDAQVWHCALPSVAANLPASHSTHTVLASGSNDLVPTGHLVHSSLPCTSEKFPAAQGVHDELPVDDA